MDKISFDDIVDGFDDQSSSFDYKKIDNMVRYKYSKQLELYDLVSPSEITDLISKGDVIRYTKRPDYELSCVSIVKDVIFIDSNKRIIDYILLGAPKRENVWKIYPSNHYIFLRDVNRLNRRVLDRAREQLTEKGKRFIDVDISPSAMKKFTDEVRAIDANLDKIFKSYESKKGNKDMDNIKKDKR